MLLIHWIINYFGYKYVIIYKLCDNYSKIIFVLDHKKIPEFILIIL